MVLSMVLFMFALVLFIVASAPVPDPWHNRLICWGLACLAAALLFEKAGPVLTR